MSSIIPARLHQLKLFESCDVYTAQDGGRLHLPGLSSLSIEEQVQRWVAATGNLLISVGPLSVTRYLVKPDPQADAQEHETRVLGILYVPPVEFGARSYGEVQETAALGKLAGVPVALRPPAGDPGHTPDTAQA